MPVKQEPFDVGDVIPVEIDFTDAADLPLNPSVYKIYVEDPAGNVSDETLNATHPSVGVYKLNVAFDEGGVWIVRAELDRAGGTRLVRERKIRVRNSDVTP